jgi:hypothetical protein
MHLRATTTFQIASQSNNDIPDSLIRVDQKTHHVIFYIISQDVMVKKMDAKICKSIVKTNASIHLETSNLQSMTSH